MLKYIDKLDSLRLKQNDGIYEPHETALFKRLLKPDDIFVDVGAHIGYYTDIASSIITNGYIYSFEPCLENFKLLKENINHKNALLHCLALGDKYKTGHLYKNKKNTGDHRLYKTKDENREGISTNIDKLDCIGVGDEINILKIDTQGFEIEVLKGAKRIIENSPDMKMLIEYCPELLKLAGHSPGELIGMIIDFGFNIYVHTKMGWRYANSETFLLGYTGHINLFCSRKRHKQIDWGN
jgi:FkbM family methyltransferase